MRRFVLLLALLACAPITAGATQAPIPVDATTKAGVVKLNHATYSWVVDANDSWSGATIVRNNHGVTRWPAKWTSTSIKFDAVCTTIQVGNSSDFAVVVDGAVQQTITLATNTFATQTTTVTGLTIAGGGSTVEVWENDGNRQTPQNTGVDGPWQQCYVTAIYLTPLSSALASSTISLANSTVAGSVYVEGKLAKPTASTVIVTIGDSIIGTTQTGVVTPPAECWQAVTGVLRKDAEAKGWLLVSIDQGSSTLGGEGRTAAQEATLIQDAANSAGSPTTVYVYIQIGWNDKRYYSLNGFSFTPTQFGTYLTTLTGALPGSYHIILATQTPGSAGNEAANTGGFTMTNYRTAGAAVTGSNITNLDGTSWGIVVGTDEYDGLHLLPSGIAKVITAIEPSMNLP